jgi:CIC family chloride channel protein
VHSLSGYGWHAVLGLASGCVAALIPSVFYGTRDLFRKIPVPAPLLPAIGGLGVGLLALKLPQVLGGGYGWIQEAIDGRIALDLAMVLLIAKLLSFSLTIGSGGSGGVFAPNLFLGAMLGAGIAQFTHHPSPAFVVVGMVAVFGAAARVPIAALFMVTEMTGVFHMLVPAALAVTLAYVVQVAMSRRLPYRSLYEAQVPRRRDSPAHYEEHLRAALGLLRRRELAMPADIGGIDLVSLLLAGIPVELPGEKQLHLARLLPESECVGKPLHSGCLTAGDATFEVVGILRDEDFLLPESEPELHAEDRLLLIAAADTWEVLAKHVESLDVPLNSDG